MTFLENSLSLTGWFLYARGLRDERVKDQCKGKAIVS